MGNRYAENARLTVLESTSKRSRNSGSMGMTTIVPNGPRNPPR